MLSLTQQGEKKRRRIMSMWLESESKQEDVMKKLQAMVWTSWVYIGRHPDLNVPQLYPEFNLEELSIIEGWIKSTQEVLKAKHVLHDVVKRAFIVTARREVHEYAECCIVFDVCGVLRRSFS